MAAYAIVILAARNPPAFVDYPDWVFQGELLHHVLLGHPDPAYALKHYPIPNSTTTVGIGLLDLVMPWNWAGKVWICLYLALAAVASWHLSRATRTTSWKLSLALPAIVFLNLNFWYGHIGFEVGVCLTMLFAAMLLRGSSVVALSLMLVAIFFAHMEACAAAMLLLLVWARTHRQSRPLAALIPSAILTLWYAVARFRAGNVDGLGLPKSDYSYGSSAFFIYKANTLFKTFGYVNVRANDTRSISEALLGRGPFLLLSGLSLAIAALALTAVISGALKSRKPGGRALPGTFVLLLLALSLVLPHVLLGVADPGTRLLLLATALGLFCVDWRGPVATAVACLSVIFCLVNLVQLTRVQRDPTMPGHPKDLPAPLLTYSHVEPATRLEFYDRLRDKHYSGSIFPTAMFREIHPASAR